LDYSADCFELLRIEKHYRVIEGKIIWAMTWRETKTASSQRKFRVIEDCFMLLRRLQSIHDEKKGKTI